MARLNKQTTTREYDFETVLVVVAKGGRDVRGYLKNPRTGLAEPEELFDGEERLGALVDDLSEALDIIGAWKKDA